MTPDEHLYHILLTQGPLLWHELEEISGMETKFFVETLHMLFERDVVNWTTGDLGDVYIGLKQ